MGVTAPIFLSEVECVLRMMKTGSAPGPNGLATEFYRSFSSVIGPAFLRVITEVLAIRVFPVPFRSSCFVLLQKYGGDPSKPQSWRPISLLNCNYKLFWSLLVVKLRVIMPLIVNPSQTCSVPGRSIFSSLSLTLDFFGVAARNGLKGLFVGLDRDMAFYLVEHDYLFSVWLPTVFCGSLT